MRFDSTTKVQAECTLKYYSIFWCTLADSRLAMYVTRGHGSLSLCMCGGVLS